MRYQADGNVGSDAERKAHEADHLTFTRLLGKVDLFASLDRVTLAKMAAHLQPLSYEADAIILRQGDPGDAFYLVASGAVGVYVTGQPENSERRVALLHEGEPFGEMALLTTSPRSATVKAEGNCKVLRLERASFLELAKQQPGIALAIAATITRRLARMLPNTDQQHIAAEAPSPHAAEDRTRGRPIRTAWIFGRGGFAVAAAAAVLAVGWLLPQPPGMPLPAWRALVLLFAALPALALDVLLEGIVGLLLASGWVLLGVAAPAIALSGFTSTSWMLVVAVLIAGTAVTATGLLYRLSLGMINYLRGGFAGEVTALSLAGLLVSPAVPVAVGRIMIIAPMLKELTGALGYRPQSRGAAGLSMAILMGFAQMSAVFLTSSATAILVVALLPQPARTEINWITWTLYGAPMNAVLFIGLVASLFWLYRPAKGERQPAAERAASLALQRALLGPMTREEKVALGVSIAMLAGFTTQPLHGIDPAWIAVLATGVLTAARVVTLDTLRAVNWNFVLFYGVLISLATVFERTGLDRWMLDQVLGLARDVAAIRIVFVVLLVLFCFAINLVVRWPTAAPLVTIAVAPVASVSGIHPIVVGMVAVIACNGFFLPYQSTAYGALYAGTGGALFTHRQAIPAALAYNFWTLVAAVASVPIWHWMGLL